ncbi:MAG: HigA family addiction module antitoxin [Desulfovermiculus sp.]|nr:HigA family addiction module antitoxin [Desulfovermiculus sp.]
MANARKNEFSPNIVFPPGDTLRETIASIGMSQADLALRMGVTEKHINEVIKGRATITEGTALKLEKVLGIDASFWRNLEHQYRKYLAEQEERERLSQKYEWLSDFPLKKMISRGWISGFDDKVSQLAELLAYFGVATWESWHNIWIEQAAFRKSPVFQNNPKAIAAWLRRGEILAQTIDCEPFDKKAFKYLLPKLKELSTEQPSVYLPQIQKLFSECGVAVVFVSELPETRVSGVARWLHKGKALIQLSGRYKKDDHFWFTLFHEAGHILLHGKKEVFLEDEGQEQASDKETEANTFAANMLIPPKEYTKLTKGGKPSLNQIQDHARKLGIAPGIVVGRLQHDRILLFSQGNNLKKDINLEQDLKSRCS